MLVTFKYPENKDMNETSSDEIVFKFEKPEITKGLHSFKFGKVGNLINC